MNKNKPHVVRQKICLRKHKFQVSEAHIKENFVNIVPEQQERLHALFDKFGFSFDELKSNYIKRLLFNVSMMYDHFNKIDNKNAKPKQKTLL